MQGHEEKETPGQWMIEILMLSVVAISMRQLRGLHAGKVSELADSILSSEFDADCAAPG